MNNRRLQSKGFTLIELLVTISIFIILTSVVLAKYRTFNTNAGFANATEDIVTALRQTQVYGIGAKGESGLFTVPYGVYFDTGTPSQIKLFADRNATPDGKYVALDDSPVIETVSWQNGIIITAVNCGASACSGGRLHVTFKRPNVDAVIRDDNGVQYEYATVVITNGTKTSTVVITKAGQISIQ